MIFYSIKVFTFVCIKKIEKKHFMKDVVDDFLFLFY